MVGVEAEVWLALGARSQCGACLQPGEMDTEAYVRTLCEGQVTPCPGPPRDVLVGMLEDRRVPVGGGDRHPYEVAFVDVRSGERGFSCRVAVDHRGGGLEPERFVDDRVEVCRIGRGRVLEQV